MTATFRNSGIDGAGFQGHIAVDPRGNGVAISCADVAGTHRTDDWAETWVTIVGYAYGNDHLSVAGALFSEANPDVVVILTGRSGVSVGGGVWISVDNGLTYAQQSGSPTFAGGNTSAATSILPNPHPRSTGRLAAIDYSRGFLYVGSYNGGVFRAPFNPTTGVCGSFTNIGVMSGRYVRSICLDEATDQLFVACRHNTTAADDGVFLITSAHASASSGTKITGAPRNAEELFLLGGRVYCCAGGNVTSGIFSCTASSPSTWTDRTGSLDTAQSRWQAIDGYVDSGGAHRLFVGCEAPFKASIGSSDYANAVYRCDDGRNTPPTWTSLTFMVDADVPRTYPTGELWWLSIEDNSFMINKGTYDCAQLALGFIGGTGDPDYLFAAGRSGDWRLVAPLGDPTGNWNPVVNGMAVTINRCVAADPTRDDQVAIGNVDWVVFLSDDGGDNVIKDKPSDNACYGLDNDPTSGYLYAAIGHRDTNTIGIVHEKASPSAPWVDTDSASSMSLQQAFGTAAAAGTWPVTEDAHAWAPTYTVSGFGDLSHISAAGGLGLMASGAVGNGTRVVRYQNAVAFSGRGVVRFTRNGNNLGSFCRQSMLTKAQWHLGPNRYYEFAVNRTAGGVLALQVYRQDTGTLPQLGSDVIITDLGWDIGSPLWMSYQARDNDLGNVELTCSVWTGTLGDEPETPTFEFTDSSVDKITGSGGQGAKLSTGGGQSNNVVYSWDDWTFDGTALGGGSGVDARVAGVAAATVGIDRVIVCARQESTAGPGGTQTLFAIPANSGGLYRKVGSGAWNQILSPSANGVMDNQGSKNCTFSWVDQGTITNQKVYWYEKANGVWRSTTSGATWTRIWSATSNSERTGFVSADPTNPNRLYINSGGDLYRGDNAGTCLTDALAPTLINPPTGAGRISAIFCDYRGWIWACGNRTSSFEAALWMSQNQGITWADVADDAYKSTAILPFDMVVGLDNHITIALNGNGVLLSDGIDDNEVNISSSPVGFSMATATPTPAGVARPAAVGMTLAANTGTPKLFPSPAAMTLATPTSKVVQKPSPATITLATARPATIGGIMPARDFNGNGLSSSSRLYRTTGFPALSNDFLATVWAWCDGSDENGIGVLFSVQDSANNILMEAQTLSTGASVGGDGQSLASEPIISIITGATTTNYQRWAKARARNRWVHYTFWWDASANRAYIYAANQYEQYTAEATYTSTTTAISGTRRVGTSSTNKIMVGDRVSDNRAFNGRMAQLKIVHGGSTTWDTTAILAYAKEMQQAFNPTSVPGSAGTVLGAWALDGTGTSAGVVETDSSGAGMDLSTDATRAPASIAGPVSPTFRVPTLHFDIPTPEWTLFSSRHAGGNTYVIQLGGTYNAGYGAVDSVEARMRGETTWQTIATAVTGIASGVWTGNFTMTVDGANDIGSGVEVRVNWNSLPSETATWNIGLGDLFMVGGQSNATGTGGQPNDLRANIDDSGTTIYSGSNKAHLLTNRSATGLHTWAELVDPIDAEKAPGYLDAATRVTFGSWVEDPDGTMDPTDTNFYSTGASASPWPVVAAYWMRWTGRPFGALPIAKPGAGITTFGRPVSNYSTAYNSSPVPQIYEETAQRLEQISNLANGTTAATDSTRDPIRTQAKALLWTQGESDAVNNAANSYATTRTNFDPAIASLLDTYADDFGTDIMVAVIGQVSAADTNDEASIAVRKSLQENWNTTIGSSNQNLCLRGPVLYDLVLETTGGFLHYRYDDTDNTLRTAAKRWALATYDAYIAANPDAHRGPRLVSFIGSGTAYVATFDQSLDAQASGYNGIMIRDGSTLRTWTASAPTSVQYTAVRDGTDLSKVNITMGAAPSGTLNITLGEINSTNGRRVPMVTHSVDGLSVALPAEVVYRQNAANDVNVPASTPATITLAVNNASASVSVSPTNISPAAVGATFATTVPVITTSMSVSPSPAAITVGVNNATATAPDQTANPASASIAMAVAAPTITTHKTITGPTPAQFSTGVNTPSVNIEEEGPIAVISPLPGPTVAPATINFDASTSTGVAPLTYSWDFGDGGTDSGVTVSHTYSAPGDYVVVLTVTQAGGQTDTDQAIMRMRPTAFVPGDPGEGSMIDVVRITVTTTETLVWDGGTGLGETALNRVSSENDRTYNFVFRNKGAGIVYIGKKNNTTSALGFPLAVNEQITFEAGFADRIYATSASSSALEILIGGT